MKISGTQAHKISQKTSQNLANSESKALNSEISESKKSESIFSKIKNSFSKKDVQNSQGAQNIKASNEQIGKLQTLQKALGNIENKVENFKDLDSENFENLKGEVGKIIKEAKFEGKGVFDIKYTDSKGSIVFAPDSEKILGAKDAPTLEKQTKSMANGASKAIETLNKDAQKVAENMEIIAPDSEKMAELENLKSQKSQGKIAKFFSNFGEKLKASTDAQKLDSERVHKLIS